MDRGSSSSITGKRNGRNPLQEMRYNRKASQENLDRFIPNRSAMDFDFAHYMLTEGRKIEQSSKEEGFCPSPYGEGYKKLIAETLGMDRTRILAFKSKPPEPVELFPRSFLSADTSDQSQKPKKHHRQISQTADRILDAPGMEDDFYSNLLDWGSNNIISIALENSVYLWDGSTGATKELVVTDDEKGPVTSVKWSHDEKHLAVGLTNSDIQLWDAFSAKLLRTLTGVHQSRVGSLDWNKHILTTGGLDGKITNNDVRMRSHIIETYRGHNQEICALKWSSSGQQLASGGNDNLLHIWDRSMANSERWLHRFQDHTAAVKGLAWCPFQANLLASGGGAEDGCIKFWNSHTGACLNSVNTGSQVCALLWSTKERELLSAHGFNRNQLTLWKYPSMVRIAELTGHTSRVLYMAQSPNGCTVATASGDETLRLWNVFGVPEMAANPAPKTTPRPAEPFANFSQIR